MAYIFIHLLINLILFYHNIDGIVINCTVYPTILQQIPDQILATIAVANSSNEEIFWSYVNFKTGVQFPLNFLVAIDTQKIISGSYTFQLHIYKLPRSDYDLPLWSADSIDPLTRSVSLNSVTFFAHSDREPIGPCIMGIIVNTNRQNLTIKENKLLITVGTMPLITLHIHVPYFPVLFMITNIPLSQIKNSTLVTLSISNSTTVGVYEARRRAVFGCDNMCTTLLFKVAEQKSMNLTVTMSAHVLTSISLFSLAATYRIYQNEDLIFEQSEIIDSLEFPFITRTTLVPITTATNYSIESIISGPDYLSNINLFQGVINTRLVPGTSNNVKISMVYIGPKLGTTIIGTVQQASRNQSTWPLAGSNLAFAIDNEATGLAHSNQFTIFDQTFPIQFTLLNVNEITQSHQNVTFTITITYRDGTVIWEATTINNRIIFGQLNKLDIGLAITDGYTCEKPGQGWCNFLARNLNETCCSQFKCFDGDCTLP